MSAKAAVASLHPPKVFSLKPHYTVQLTSLCHSDGSVTLMAWSTSKDHWEKNLELVKLDCGGNLQHYVWWDRKRNCSVVHQINWFSPKCVSWSKHRPYSIKKVRIKKCLRHGRRKGLKLLSKPVRGPRENCWQDFPPTRLNMLSDHSTSFFCVIGKRIRTFYSTNESLYLLQEGNCEDLTTDWRFCAESGAGHL